MCCLSSTISSCVVDAGLPDMCWCHAPPLQEDLLPRRCRRSPPSLSHLSLVVTLSHLSLIVTSAESWHVDTPHTRVPCSGFSCYGPGHCYLALLPRCLLLWLSRCLVSLSRLAVSFIRERLAVSCRRSLELVSLCAGSSVYLAIVWLSCLGLVRYLLLASFLVVS
jgi:hypothetical protein